MTLTCPDGQLWVTAAIGKREQIVGRLWARGVSLGRVRAMTGPCLGTAVRLAGCMALVKTLNPDLMCVRFSK